MTTTNKMKEEIKQHGIDRLKDGIGIAVYGCDLHNELYNMDYFIIGTYDATKFMETCSWDCIKTVKKYEQNNFGEVSTDLSNPEKVVNMYAYVIGEEILSESPTLQENYDNILTEENVDQIITELEEL